MGGTQNNKVIPHRYDLCKNLPRQYRFVEKWICLSSCPEISGLELAWLRRHVRSRLPHMVFHPCRIRPHSESRKTWICMTGNLLQVWQPYAGTFSSFFGGVGGVSYKRRFFSTHVHFSCFAYGCVCKSSPCVAASTCKQTLEGSLSWNLVPAAISKLSDSEQQKTCFEERNQ